MTDSFRFFFLLKLFWSNGSKEPDRRILLVIMKVILFCGAQTTWSHLVVIVNSSDPLTVKNCQNQRTIYLHVAFSLVGDGFCLTVPLPSLTVKISKAVVPEYPKGCFGHLLLSAGWHFNNIFDNINGVMRFGTTKEINLLLPFSRENQS